MNSPPEATLTALGLGKRYSDEWAVQDVDLSVEQLQILGLIGPSGCGKTTLVRMMNGALAPDAGSVLLFDKDPRAFTHSDRQRIGYLPQQPVLFPELSLWENLNFHASLAGVRFRRRARLRELLDFVDLGPDRRKKAHQASGGMLRRLALIATLVHQPEVLFLDEPTAGIDPILRRRIWERLRELNDGGTLLIVTTQFVGEASYCDTIGLLSEGRLVSHGSPTELAHSAYGGELVEITTDEMLSDELFGELHRIRGVVRVERSDGTTTRASVTEAAIVSARIVEWLEERGCASATVDSPAVDYDDVFVRVIERHRASEETSSEAVPV